MDSTSSSYSSLSDFVSEMQSSDLSPSCMSYQEQRKATARNISICSNVDVAQVYKPPSELHYPDGEVPVTRSDSPQSSSSSDSDLSSPSFNRDSEIEYNSKNKSETIKSTSKVDKEESGSCENESDSNSTMTPKTTVSMNTVKTESASSTNSESLDRPSTPRKTRRSVTPVSVSS